MAGAARAVPRPDESFLGSLSSDLGLRPRSGPRTRVAAVPCIPTRDEVEFAVVAVEKHAISPAALILALDLQEKRRQLGEAVSIQKVLEDEGLLGPGAIGILERTARRRRSAARDAFFAKSLVARRILPADVVRAERERFRQERAVSNFVDHLFAGGHLGAQAHDAIQRAWLSTSFREEDELFAWVALRAGVVSRADLERVERRRRSIASRDKAPLPIHAILLGMNAVTKGRSDLILRAIRRHRMTGAPIAQFAPLLLVADAATLRAS